MSDVADLKLEVLEEVHKELKQLCFTRQELVLISNNLKPNAKTKLIQNMISEMLRHKFYQNGETVH